jgi:hypothetical protein
VTAVTTETRPAPPLCGDRADAVQSCARDLGHNGPHRHPERGEWLNLSADAAICPARTTSNLGGARCRRDPGHEGGHADHKRGIYWQAEVAS